jgi:hypothetical protein
MKMPKFIISQFHNAAQQMTDAAIDKAVSRTDAVI